MVSNRPRDPISPLRAGRSPMPSAGLKCSLMVGSARLPADVLRFISGVFTVLYI